MPRKMRRICSVCDKDLPETNAAPGDPDVKYVNDPHRGCIEPREKKPVESTLGSRGALDGSCVADPVTP